MYDATGKMKPLGDTEVRRYAPLIKQIAKHLAARLPTSVSLDDLLQIGAIGLLEAAASWDSTRGIPFEAFATQRIRGSMLDELRRIDWLPKGARTAVKKMEAEWSRLSQTLGRAPTDGEVATEMGMSLAEYATIIQDGYAGTVLNWEAMGDPEESGSAVDRMAVSVQSPYDEVAQKAFAADLAGALADLPEREKMVLSLYYEQDLNFKEIGLVLGVTESRVCQLHGQATKRLGTKMTSWRPE